MTWNIEFTPEAKSDLSKLDTIEAKRCLKFLYERVSKLENPRITGKPLTGNLSGLWRYRVGNYRILCKIEDNKICVVVVQIGHRSDIYKS